MSTDSAQDIVHAVIFQAPNQTKAYGDSQKNHAIRYQIDVKVMKLDTTAVNDQFTHTVLPYYLLLQPIDCRQSCREWMPFSSCSFGQYLLPLYWVCPCAPHLLQQYSFRGLFGGRGSRTESPPLLILSCFTRSRHLEVRDLALDSCVAITVTLVTGVDNNVADKSSLLTAPRSSTSPRPSSQSAYTRGSDGSGIWGSKLAATGSRSSITGDRSDSPCSRVRTWSLLMTCLCQSFKVFSLIGGIRKSSSSLLYNMRTRK